MQIWKADERGWREYVGTYRDNIVGREEKIQKKCGSETETERHHLLAELSWEGKREAQKISVNYQQNPKDDR